MKRVFAMILTAAMMASLAGCGGTSNPGTTAPDAPENTAGTEKTKIILATGGTSGTYYAVGGVLQTVLSPSLNLSTISVAATGASVANVNMITDGEAQMAILQSDVINYAHEGTYDFEGEPEDNALWVAGIYNETIQILARPGIESISDLKGKTVCVGDVGSGTEVSAWQVLGAAGLTKEDIHAVNGSFQDGVDQLKDGKIDAAFTVAGAPTTAIVDYATTNEMNLISLTEDEVSKLQADYPFLIRDDLKANTYDGQAEDVTCVAIQAVLVASDELSEEVVYEVLKGMFDHQAELSEGHAKFSLLTPESASAGATVPMHPGAEKYYKEIGVL